MDIEITKQCDECEGTGRTPAELDELKDDVRNIMWLSEQKKKPFTFAEMAKLYRRKKREYVRMGECLPCDHCGGEGSFTRHVWRGEL